MGIETTQRIFVAEDSKNKTTNYQINNPDGSTVGVKYIKSDSPYYTVEWGNSFNDPGNFFASALDSLKHVDYEAVTAHIHRFTAVYPSFSRVKVEELTPRFKINPDNISYATLRIDRNIFYYYLDRDRAPHKSMKNLKVESTRYMPEILTDFVIQNSSQNIDKQLLQYVLDYVGRGQID